MRISTDDRLFCHCPSPCAERATQEDGLCDTCRSTPVLGVDPARDESRTHIVAIENVCLHVGTIGDPLDARKPPYRFTRSYPVIWAEVDD